ncbi:MAG TPA: hypothetical protein PLP18_03360 [Smithellaceae bacterium]|nr:hypothetical protein [Smithellaceae bacterium]
MTSKKNILYQTHKKVKEAISARKKVLLWKLQGRPVPAPHAVKQMINKYYAAKFKSRVFVETGTYMGEMIDAVLHDFSKIISIEFDPKLAQRAKNKFSSASHVTILQGDSGKILPVLLAEIKEPCLFWLDAHFSGGVTGQADSETPIIKEIKAILEHSCSDHVVLIDDAREFTGNKNYPTLEELRQLIQQRRKEWRMVVDADIIRIHK